LSTFITIRRRSHCRQTTLPAFDGFNVTGMVFLTFFRRVSATSCKIYQLFILFSTNVRTNRLEFWHLSSVAKRYNIC
jgi:hypothetical protein